MASEDFVIDIILRARDAMAPAIAKAAAELEGLKKVANDSSRSFEDLDRRAGRAADNLRAKMQGLDQAAESSRRRNESLGDSYDRLGREIDQSSQQATVSSRRYNALNSELEKNRRSAHDAAEEMKRLQAAGAGTNQQTELQRRRMEELNRTYDESSRKVDSVTRRMNEHAQAQDRLSRSTNELRQNQDRNIRDLDRLGEAYRRQTDSVARARAELDRARRTPGVDENVTRRIEGNLDREQRKVKELGAEWVALREIMRRPINTNVHADVAKAEADLAGFELVKAAAGSDITVNVDVDTAAATAHLAAFNATASRTQGTTRGLIGTFRDLASNIQASQSSIARFDNTLRGLAVFLVVGLMQQLITVVISLGGELVALASSAVMAGGALGGAFVAGIAQALPVVGLLVAAFSRVAAVMNAVQEQLLVRQQQNAQTQKTDESAANAVNTLANAHQSLVSAQQGVINAQQQLRDAQVSLTRARFEATRQLQDLILAEKQAELAARGAVLSQEDAQRQLTAAIVSGDVAGVSQAQLGVSEAELSRRQADIQRRRSQQDLQLQQAGSPLRPDTGVQDAERQVQQARQGVEQARQAVEQARRGIESARNSVKQANSDFLASAAKMNYMLAQLDDAEKRLYRGLLQLRDTFMKVFRPITDIIVNSITHAVHRVNALIQDPQLLGGFRNLAHAIGDSFNRVVDTLTSPRWVRFFTQMMNEAARNIKPLTDAFLNLAEFFRKVAITAEPVLRFLIRGFRDFTATLRAIPRSELTDFFQEAIKHLRAWLQLFGAIGKLMLALIGSSAQEGLRSVKALTGALNEATAWIEDNPKKMQRFWRGVAEVMGTLGKVVIALGRELVKSFDPDAVKALGDVIVRVLIPALGQAIRLFGQMVKVLDAIARNPAGEFFLKFAVGATIFKAVITPIFGILSRGVGTVLAFSRAIGATVKGFAIFDAAGAEVASGSEVLTASFLALDASVLLIPAAIAAAVVAFVLLAKHFGVLDDLINAFKDAWHSIVRAVTPAIQGLVAQVRQIGRQLGFASKDASPLGEILRFIFVNLVLHIIIPAIKLWGVILGNFFATPLRIITGLLEEASGAIKIFGGVIEIVVGIFTLNGDKIKQGAKDIIGGIGRVFKGMFDVITAPFRLVFTALIRIVGNVGGRIINAIKNLAGDIVHFLINGVKRLPGLYLDVWKEIFHLYATVGGRVLNALKSGFVAVFDWFRGLPGRIGNAMGDVAGAVVSGAKKIPGLIADAFTAVGGVAGNIGQAIIKWINDNTPFGDSIHVGIPGPVPDIDFTLPALRRGGPIGKGYGGGDRFLGMLEEGEHVLTKEEVRAAGGHAAIFALRSLLGGGSQSFGRRFQQGGQVDGQGGGGGADHPRFGQGDSRGALDALLDDISHFGQAATKRWNGIWDDIQKRTQRGNNFVVNQFQRMQRNANDLLTRMQTQTQRIFNAMVDTAQTKSRAFSRYVGNAMTQADRATYQGLSYISDAVQKGLKAFDSKDQVHFNVPKPGAGGGGGAGHARGGFVGMPGERGGDVVPTWLGRGEAVLNWAHQRLVDPAMRFFYGFGLDDMFHRHSAQHAGGGGEGLAGGGRPRSPYRFPLKGDFVWERTDMGVDFGGTPTIGAIGAGRVIRTGAPNWPGGSHGVLYKMSAGAPQGYHPSSDTIFVYESLNEMVHGGQSLRAGQVIGKEFAGGISTGIEMGWADPSGSGSTLAAVTTGYYEGEETPAGKSFRQFLQDLASGKGVLGGAGAIQDVARVLVKGTDGPLRDVVQGALDSVREAANKYIDKIAATTSTAMGSEGIGRAFKALPGDWFRVGATYEGLTGATGYRGDTVGGMNFAELLVAGANAGMWHEDLAATLGLPNRAGEGMPNHTMIRIRKPGGRQEYHITKNDIGSGQPGDAHIKIDLQDAIASRLAGKTTQDVDVKKMAEGGMVNGPLGSATPIIAHAGEWIVNPGQQGRLAQALGTSIGQLRDFMGFTGGPTSFQGGGEVASLRGLFQLIQAWVQEMGRGGTHLHFPSPGRGDDEIDVARHEFSLVERLIKAGARNLTGKTKKLEDAIRHMFAGLTGDGGILDQMAQGFEDLQTSMETTLDAAIVRINRFGRVIGRRLQPDQILNRELRQLQDELRYLIGEQGVIQKALNKAQHALRVARRQNDENAENAARAAIANLQGRMRDINNQIAQQQLTILEKMEEKLQARVQAIEDDANRALSGFNPRTHQFGIEIRQRIAEAFGRPGQIPVLLQAQIDVLKNEQQRLRNALRDALRVGDQDLANQIESQIADIQASVAELTAQIFQTAQDAIDKAAARREAAIDIQNRVADVQQRFGNTVLAAQIQGTALVAQRADIQQQIRDYQKLLASALAQGFGTDITNPLRDKLADLIEQLDENNASIYENTIAIRQASIDAITNRQTFLGGVSSGLQDIVTKIGEITGTVNTSSLINLVQSAITQLQNTGQDLRNQMTNFVNQVGGLGPAGGVLETLQGLHGQDFVNAIAALNLSGIVDQLGGPDSPLAQQFEALLQAIIDNESAIQDNTEQLQQLNQMNNIQSFTSTAWQWFRRAIFTGMGGLLPEYAAGEPFFEAPSAQTGGDIIRSGLHQLHAGEMVIPPDWASRLRRMHSLAAFHSVGGAPMSIDFATRQAATIQAEMGHAIPAENLSGAYDRLRQALEQHGNIDLTVNEADHGADYTYLASRLAFERNVPSA